MTAPYQRGKDIAQAIELLSEGVGYSKRHFAKLGMKDKVQYLDNVLKEAVRLLERVRRSDRGEAP